MYKKILLVCLFLIIFFTTGCNSKSTENQLPNSKPKDFNFIFNYGVNAINQLNTVEGKYTKDMIGDPSITIDLKLSDEQMNDIYKTMRDIDILSYPGIFTPESKTWQTPFSTYNIRIYYDGKEKSIHWADEKDSKTKEAVQLRDLFEKIQEIINNTDEYKKLPAAEGGYA